MRSASFDSGSKRPRRRAVMFLGIVSLLLSLLSPLITLHAADVAAEENNEEQQECEPGFVFDDNLGYCVEEPECPDGEIYDPAQQGCVTDPDQQQEDPIGIQIEKWDCQSPEAYDWGYEQLQQECSPSENEYTLVHGGDGIQESPQQATGYYEWTGDPAGNHYVYEQIPDGYGQPRVFCGVYDPDQGQPSPTEASVENGNAVGWQLNPGEYVYCYWFNVQAGYGEIHITKYDCAAYTGAPDSEGWEFWQQECAPWSGDPVEYQLYQGQNEVDSQTTDDSGEAHFSEAPTGNVTIAEVLPEGYSYSLVFCSYHPVEEQNGASYEPVQVQDGFFHTWDLEADYILDCLWFNFYEPGEGNWIDFYKYVCPWDAAKDQEFDYYPQTCEPAEGWEFDVQWDGGGSTEQTDSEGKASWSEVPSSDWSASESQPEGYGDPVIWCRYVEWPDEAGYDNNWFQPPSTGASFELGFESDYSGVRIECYWFNFEPEDGDYNYIDFYKYVCPYDLEPSGGVDYYLEECAPREGWEFDVSWEGGGSQEFTDGEGKASWSGVPQGAWTGSESLDEGWGQPLLWCRYVEWPDEADYDSDWFQFDLAGGSTVNTGFDYDGIYIECYWFNFEPEQDYNWVDFYKYVCPYDVPTDGGVDYYLEECKAYEGWQFDLEWDGGGDSGTTDSEGHTFWSGIPQGSWTGSETLDEGWGQPLVWCRYVEWPDEAGYDTDWFPADVALNGVVTIDGSFEYDQVRIECYWFNFEPEDNYNWVDFYKYTCPYDTLQEQDYQYYFDSCEAYEGWEFDLQWDGGGSSQQTDSSGKTSWSGVPQGTWTGSETLDEGWGEPTIWCRYVEWPDEAGYDNAWFPVDPVLNGVASFDWQFEYDQVRIECYWFNYEPEDNYNWVDFYKYTCPFDLPADGSFEYYVDECEVYADGWDFDLQWDGGGSPQTTDQSGKASWSGVPQGSWTASESVPEGWGSPLIWCRYVEWPDEAGYDNAWFPVDAGDSGTWTGEFEYDQVRIECYWFNFAPTDYNWIDFYKYTCAYDTPTDQEYDYYPENCEPVDGWNFNVSWQDGGDTGTTNAEGYTSWSGVPQGGWSASESVPGGWGQPIVWCRYVEWPEGSGLSDEWVRYDALDGYFEHEFEYDNVRIECYWFNFEPEGGSWIQFYKMWCSEEATYDYTFDQLREDCEFRDQPADVSLTYGGSSSTKQAQGESPAEWQGVPIGEWTVEEAQYDGWGQPIIWCQYVEWPDTAEGLSNEPFMPNTQGWQATWQHEYDGLRIACVIFNIPYEDGYIDITKWWCSEEVVNPYELGRDELLEQCEVYTEGVDFTLDYEGGSEDRTTDGDGNAAWENVPGGQWRITEQREEGWGNPVVYCYWVEWPDAAGFDDLPSLIDAPNGVFAGTFEWAGLRLHCDIFNIPEYDPGWITVYKWYCAYGLPADSSPEYLRDECDLVTTGVEFNLEYGTTSIPMTTDSEGKAEWGSVPTGSWTLSETAGSSYGEPVIWCQWVEWPEGTEGYDQELYQPEQDGASITGTHEYPGLRLVCYWFNFGYEGGDNWIIFYKYYCPPGADYGDDPSAWRDACQTQDGVKFTLENGQGSFPKTTSGGMAEWTDIEDGPYTVQEELPTGYQDPVIWCFRAEYTPGGETEAVDLASYEPASAPGGLYEDNLEGGPWRIICHWFNIPGDDSTITIYKYNCEYRPEGFNTLWQWQEACTEKADEVGFTLDNVDGSSHKETADGKVEWTDVSLGEFKITEDPYPGYGEPVVWCGWTAYYDGAIYDAFPSLYSAPGGVYEGEISYPGTTYFCYWFNIPDDHSRIVVYKYNCPSGATLEEDLGSYQEACTEKGDGIEFTLDNSSGSSTKEIQNGSATWNDVPQGDFTLTEEIPFGYGEPVWWCGFTGYEGGAIYDGFPQQVDAPGGVFEGTIEFDVTYYFCWVFNYPDYDREVTVYKWYCPEDWAPGSENYQDWKDACVQKAAGVGFTLAWDDGQSSKGTNIGGKASWYGIEPGGLTLTEQFLPGYEVPYVFCSLEAYYEDGAAYAENYTWYDVSDRSVFKDVGEYAEYKWICHFFNIPKGPGEITIYKWYCPPGYDISVKGANPTEDCTQAQNGVTYILDRPVGPNLQGETGDAGEGAIYWGDLAPGHYKVIEQVPGDVGYAFIWDCYGSNIPAVHPNPLQWGNVLDVDVAGGDSVVCHWYNVPYPDEGWITLYKYQCWTQTYKSEVDCELYEFGATFEVFAADGNASQGTGTTNAGGNYTWGGLEEGAYTLDEISHTPCKITSTKVDDSGNVWVDAGQGTIVKVYNCSQDSGTPTPGGKVPTKYPNTGVGTDGDGPVEVALTTDEDATEEPDGEQVIDPEEGTPNAQEQAAEFYAIDCLNEEEGASNGQGEEEADTTTDDGGLPPFLQDTADQSDAPEAPDDGTPASEVTCERGALPELMVIDAANVNHPVEVLEIVDGVMQAPTGPEVVSWYKETARLGEQNNMVIAAHVNWWNVPEGPFYHLADLEEGDRIEVTGEDGRTYIFEVQWVRQESNLEAPNPEVVGPTDEATLTLITCGGEWDPSISEYNERTVVRAVQVDVIEAEDTGDDGTPAADEDGQSWSAPVAIFRSGWAIELAA